MPVGCHFGPHSREPVRGHTATNFHGVSLSPSLALLCPDLSVQIRVVL
jgi:hypothetical protein